MGRRVEGFAEGVHEASVRTVEALLLEFFNHDAFLHIERVRVKRQCHHAVALKVKGRLYVLSGYAEVEIREVIACPSIAAAAGEFEFGVEIRYVFRSAEHEVLK